MPSSDQPSPKAPHSADQFGPHRDYWWNPDYLALLARRWRLEELSSMADIGCGVGHWTRLLYPFLRAPARLIAIDREPAWVTEAERRFADEFPAAMAPRLAEFRQGDAAALPVPDEAVDFVTCQTVLMHLSDPRRALQEMMRILRPGGLLVCAEPNNLWNCLAPTSLTARESTESLLLRHELFFRAHRGRIVAGEGDHAIGELLPGWFASLGLEEIEVRVNDRAAAVFPPYGSPAQQAVLTEARPPDHETLKRWFVLGGGTETNFETAYEDCLRMHNAEQAAIAAGEFHAGFASHAYIVAGRKPAKA